MSDRPTYNSNQGNPNQGNPREGFPPQGYPQQQQGYPNQGYPPQQGYPQQQQGYPNQGYPPQQGYPQQQQGNPNQGYPPQQGYPQQQQGYPPQQGYPQGNPQQQRYPPNQGCPQQPQQGYSNQPTYPGQMSYNQPQQCSNNYSNVPAQSSPYPQGQPTHQGNPQNEGPRMRPTVRPFGSFSAEADAKSLRKAMKGMGTTESVIIEITGNRNNGQRLQIREEFRKIHGRDLMKDLDSELSGSFNYLVMACYMSPVELDVESLSWAIQGAGTNEEMLNMIMVSRPPNEMRELQKLYLKKYGRSLESDISNDTHGHYSKILLDIAKCNRQISHTVDTNMAQADATELYSAGVARWGTNEGVFHQIFTSRSLAQLKQTFKEYARVTGHSIDQAIRKEMSGDLKDIYKALVDYIIDPITFFAHLLHKSMKGLGTNDHLLCYIIISRSEIDLADIKDAYLNLYKDPLMRAIKQDTRGDYEKLLLLLVGEH